MQTLRWTQNKPNPKILCALFTDSFGKVAFDRPESEKNKMKTKYTPGAWMANGREIVGDRFVAKIYDWSVDESKTVYKPENDKLRAEAEANARLIAAAPELKFYLEDLIEQIKQFPQIRDGINLSYALKAIAKAEGE